MAEHTPAPTADRAVYGFALYLLFHSLFILYVFWAFVPTSILEEKLGLFYLPDKYFALFIPILLLCGVTLFAFFIYPSLSLMMTPDIDDPVSMCDKFTIHRCQFVNDAGKKCDNKVVQSPEGWTTENFCGYHQKKLQGIRNVTLDDNEITDFCDCPPERPCLLKESSNHIITLKKKSKIATVSDMDLADVCEQIFLK